jgi:hypothetical protein
MNKLRFFHCLVWLVNCTVAVGCNRSSGTYVVLDFQGAVPTPPPIHSIALDLDMSGQKAPAVFTAPSGGEIKLPTDAVLQIQHGSGDLTVTATAKSADGRVVGTGTGSGKVVAGQTIHVTVVFGGIGGDAGLSRDGSGDVATEGPAGSGGATGTGGAGMDGPGGTDGAGGASGGAGGGAAGAGGAGGGAQDAGPDGPSGGTGGGTGAAKIVSEPSALPFGDIRVGSTSAPMSTIIRNLGNAPAPALSVKLPPTASSFEIKADLCSGKMLAPDDTCTISVVFYPTALGSVSAVLSVDAGGVSGTDITLTGTGVSLPLEVLTLQPTQGSFGAVDVGSSSSVTFAVTSSSASALFVSNTGGPVFQLTDDHCSNWVPAVSTACTFGVTFAPSAAGPASGTVTVKPSDGTTPVTAALSGAGRDYVTLSVKLTGNGTGTVAGSGLTCQAGICTGRYPTTEPPGSPSAPTVTLTAKPDLSSTFGGWMGGGCAAASTCTVVLTSSTTVAATFNAVTVTPLMVEVGLNALGLAGQTGSLRSADNSLTCSGSCAPVPYPAGSTIALSAKPDPGFTFIGWTEGPCRGTSPVCTFAPTSDVVVSATFGPQAYMFVTSSMVIPGKLGGVAGADVECTKRAAAAGLPGNYRAWLSSSAVDAKSRVGNGGWVRVDGRPFARNLATLGVLTNQVLYYPPRIDEMGNDVGPGHVMVATGGNQDGSSFASQCGDYTDPAGSLYVGDAIAGSGYWAHSQLMTNGCSTAVRLYCFNSTATGDINPAPLPGRHVFVTASGWSPSGGIANADAFCRADAAAANLANAPVFVALLATSTATAASRLTMGGAPWKRVDDVFVFRSPNDLTTNNLLAPVDLVADGSLYGDFSFWSGAKDPGSASPADASCQDWSTSSAAAHGLYGNANLSGGPEWFGNPTTTPNTCDRTNTRLLCAEP